MNTEYADVKLSPFSREFSDFPPLKPKTTRRRKKSRMKPVSRKDTRKIAKFLQKKYNAAVAKIQNKKECRVPTFEEFENKLIGKKSRRKGKKSATKTETPAATESPTTEPAVTEPAVTEASTTESPTTESPTQEKPTVTESPTQEKPAESGSSFADTFSNAVKSVGESTGLTGSEPKKTTGGKKKRKGSSRRR
jgi:hypothetical protein